MNKIHTRELQVILEKEQSTMEQELRKSLSTSFHDFSEILNAHPPRYLSTMRVDLMHLLATQPYIYLSYDKDIAALLTGTSLTVANCSRFHITHFTGFDSLWGGVVMKKRSKWYTNINLVVTQRMTSQKMREFASNLTLTCRHRLFPTEDKLPSVSVAYQPLSMQSTSGVFVILAFLCTLSFVFFCVEFSFYHLPKSWFPIRTSLEAYFQTSQREEFLKDVYLLTHKYNAVISVLEFDMDN
jgi:hypothetical protein